MKRVTFVFIGIVAITTTLFLSQESNKETDTTIVKIDVEKHYSKELYD